MKLPACIILAAMALSASSHKIRYDGYTVKRVTPKTEEHLVALKDLEKIGVKFWRDTTVVGRDVDLMLPPHLKADLVDGLSTYGMQVEDFVDDVQELIELEASKINEGSLNWTSYGTLEQINAFLVEQNKKHPNITDLFSIGKTHEERDLWVLKISRGGPPKKTIWLDANIHAREWITSAVATFTVNELLNGGRQGWTEDFDWYILTLVNPDGFAYTKSTDRLWRKTRTPGTLCKGTDANRNFDFHWREGGSSTNPCSETYSGPGVFSEPETQAIRDFISTISKELVAYITLHSYSQFILIPFGHNNKPIPQFNAYMDLGHRIIQATAARYGTNYTVGNWFDLLYLSTGCSVDWVKGTYNTNLTLTYEMRDTGRYGFLLPPDQITPSAEEFLDGFAVAIAELRAGITTPDLPPDVLQVNPRRIQRAPSILPSQQDYNTFGKAPHPRQSVSPLEAFNRA